MPESILSDPKLLSQIKKMQHRQQLPPLALLAIGFLIGFVIPDFNLREVSLVLCLIAIAWYLYVGACFRYRNKIPLPPSEVLLSPLSGRIQSIKSALDNYQVKISKHALDTVEVRCPHSSCQWDEDRLKLEYRGHSLSFRFEAKQLVKLENSEMQPGAVIALLIGAASCQIILPRDLPCDLPQHAICEAGVTPLISV